MRKNYGLPYQGSKNQIAEDIIDFLPSGNRLVDLFGGGGSISHCASLSNKWKSSLYNEVNPLIAKGFEMAINGEFDNENRWITKEEFHRLKKTDPYVAICFSFSNNYKDYALSDERGDIVKKIFELRLAGKDVSVLNIDDTRCEPWERISRIRLLKGLKNIEITNGSYSDYEYREGDIVYCDPPYENYRCDGYKGFDNHKFYDWVASRPYQVFFSSYDISDNRFPVVWQKEKRALTSVERYVRTEYIYSNRPLEKKKYFVFGMKK